MTVALNCYVVTNAKAVCEPNNRAYVIDYIGKYYAKRDEMLSVAKQYGEAEIRNVRQVWNSRATGRSTPRSPTMSRTDG